MASSVAQTASSVSPSATSSEIPASLIKEGPLVWALSLSPCCKDLPECCQYLYPRAERQLDTIDLHVPLAISRPVEIPFR